LAAAIQNIRILLAHQNPNGSAAAAVVAGIYEKIALALLLCVTYRFFVLTLASPTATLSNEPSP
jgi:hypothetical protein